MGLINTQYLIQQSSSFQELAARFVPYFKGAEKKEGSSILAHLQHHGMVRSWNACQEMIDKLKEKGYFKLVMKEYKALQKKWGGPDVPVFILPVNESSKEIREQFYFQSGMAFDDKIFLFLSPNTPKERIGTLLTHEYHHVCRLHFLTKEEKDFTFLDTIMMEGLAEYAVYHRYGESYTAKWTTLYDESQLQRMYKKWVSSHLYQKVQDDERLIQNLLYGKGNYPKMLGYATGFYIVKKYFDEHRISEESMIAEPAETFLKAIES
ncbi:DUF2268 domain-containing protein [Bacillus altitudinis]|uniref:DUF2268 domain-containing protein n=1 Tax=Bacillus TaxID=1386 RepID=UPI0013C768A3|nr:DUF2268 domain-containing protein [Bacillus altitudinis]NEU53533.1 DUF2268 domain-containing protein [Bacillus altitudinis]WHF28142.1 DUF2268 domain-containing protein [Bacillus altitudinis]